jgi:hypothetical protein
VQTLPAPGLSPLLLLLLLLLLAAVGEVPLQTAAGPAARLCHRPDQQHLLLLAVVVAAVIVRLGCMLQLLLVLPQ